MEHHLLFCRTEDDLTRRKVAVTAMHEKYRKSISGRVGLHAARDAGRRGDHGCAGSDGHHGVAVVYATARADASIGQAMDAIRSAREDGDQPAAQCRVAVRRCSTRCRPFASTSAPAGCRRARRSCERSSSRTACSFACESRRATTRPDEFGRAPGAHCVRDPGGDAADVHQRRHVRRPGRRRAQRTMFLSIPNEAELSPRAITIMGATALIRAVALERREWVE